MENSLLKFSSELFCVNKFSILKLGKLKQLSKIILNISNSCFVLPSQDWILFTINWSIKLRRDFITSFIVLIAFFSHHKIHRSNHPEVFLVKGVLKICIKFIGEHPCRSAISIKLLCMFKKHVLKLFGKAKWFQNFSLQLKLPWCQPACLKCHEINSAVL